MARGKRANAASSMPLFPDKISSEELQRLLDEARKLVNYQVTDFSAELLSGKFKEDAEAEGDIFVPHYQRKLVWSDQRQSYFIESLLLRVPVSGIRSSISKTRYRLVNFTPSIGVSYT